MAHLFLSGAEMEPVAIRTAHPAARFVARARIAIDGRPVASAFADHLDGEVWGIVLSASGSAAVVETVADDGRVFAAAVDGDLVGGEPEAALAAARYWELPPAYVERLKAALSAVDEDPSDGN